METINSFQTKSSILDVDFLSEKDRIALQKQDTNNNMTPETEKTFDPHGFAVLPKRGREDSIRDHDYRVKSLSPKQIANIEKFLNEWKDSSSRQSAKLLKFINHGFPQKLRVNLWQKLLEIETLKAWTNFVYQDELDHVREQLVDLGISEFGSSDETVNFLCEVERHEVFSVKFGQISLDALRHIFLDLDRTYPTHRQYMGHLAEAQEGKAALFRVLAVYARFNGSVEYCQGMSAIAGMLLMAMDDEEQAFWCLVSMLERHKYLVGYFDNHMARLHSHAAVFDRLARQRYPRLFSHLRVCGIDSLMFLTPWFMSIYTSWPCWETVLTIWDLLLLEGNKTMFRVALTVLDLLQDDILATHDINFLLPMLLHITPKTCRFDTFIPRLSCIELEDWEINSILSIIEEEKRYPRKRPHDQVQQDGADDFSGTLSQQATKRRRKTTTMEEANTPERSGLLKKFTDIFHPRTLHSTPTRQSPRFGGRRLSGSVSKSATRQRHVSKTLTKPSATSTTTRTPLKTLNIDSKSSIFTRASSRKSTSSNSSDSDSFRTMGKDAGKKSQKLLPKPCFHHPLEQMLHESPHKAVSPALMRKFRTGPGSPLSRRVLLKQTFEPVSCSSSCKANSKDDIVLDLKQVHVCGKALLLSPLNEVSAPPSQRITRSAKKRGRRIDTTDSVDAKAPTAANMRRSSVGPGVAKRLIVPDISALDSPDFLTTYKPREESKSAAVVAKSSAKKKKRKISAPESECRTCLFPATRPSSPARHSPLRRRHVSDNVMLHTAADGLSLAEDHLSLQQFLAPRPLRPSQSRPPKRRPSFSSRSRSGSSSSSSSGWSSPEVELRPMGRRGEKGRVEEESLKVPGATPEKELQPLVDVTRTVLIGNSRNMPV